MYSPFSTIDASSLLDPMVNLELEYMQRGLKQLLHGITALTFCETNTDLLALSSSEDSNENFNEGLSFSVGVVP